MQAMDLAILEQEALKLSEADRALLADHLLNTLDPVEPSVMDAWAKEGAQRLDAFLADETDSTAGLDFIQSLRAK